MVKKLIHISDIHFRTYKRHTEYREIIEDFIKEVIELRKIYSYEELRIVVTGDIVHQKITISNELTEMLRWFFTELVKHAPVVVIAGNHDLLEENKDRLDSLSPVINLINNPNIHYLKESKCYEDENIMWATYSIFEGNARPNIEETRELHPDKKIVGLFHAPVLGSKTTMGFEFTDSGVGLDYFEGCDMVLLGDIHKRQSFDYNGVKIAYASSLVQQSYGESISGHGYLVWDVETGEFEIHDIESNYGFYNFEINSINDIDNKSETLRNYE